MMRFRDNCFLIGFVCLFGISSLSGVTVSPDKSKMSPVLVNMIDETAIESSGLKGLLSSIFLEKPSRTLLILAKDDPSTGTKMADLGAVTREISPGFHVGKVPIEAVRYISNWPSIRFIDPSRPARRMLNTSRPAVQADIVQDGTGVGLGGIPYTGVGSYVGIVDTGIYDSHKDFSDNGSMSPSRIDARLGYPGFSPGTDSFGHGTHVAGIAAGNGFSSLGLYTGMAPDAGILFYTTNFETADILSGVNQLLSAAGNAPVAINLSLGLMSGSHDGTGSFESEINTLAAGPAGSKRLISVAAGNEGDLNEHFHAVVPSLGASTTVTVTLPSSIDPTWAIDFWGTGSNDISRRNEHDEYLVSAVIGSTVSLSVSNNSTISRGGLTVSNLSNYPLNGATHISIIPAASLAGQAMTVTFTRTWAGGEGVLDGYLDAVWNGSQYTGQFSPSTAAGSIIEPANGDSVISVGAWVTRTSPDFWGSINTLTQFTSPGPTRDGRVKPDIIAPGANIYSARSRNASFASSEIVPSNDNYVIMSGTSMATPHITGIAALVWESNPALTGAQLRERLRMSATAVGSVPNNLWGYGKANALKAITSTVASIIAPPMVETGSPVALDSSNSSGSFGAPVAFGWSLSTRPAGSSATLSGTTATASFTPDKPGDYSVTLAASQSSPVGVAPAIVTTTIHANRIPTLPLITGPASSSTNDPAAFSASSVDPDGFPLSWNWILVSKPAGSGSSISGSGSNATLFPDTTGNYIVGVRSNDGEDNSILAIHSYSSGGPPPVASPPTAAPGQSPIGGCGILPGTDQGPARDIPWLIAIAIVLIPVSGRLFEHR